jgi:hypothetical protein
MSRYPILLLPLALACRGERNPENSAMCGFTAMAAGTMILDQFHVGSTVLSAAPTDLAGTGPARVVGRGSARALVARTDSGVTLGFEGEGFPPQPGFASSS